MKEAIVVGGKVKAVLMGVGNTFAPKAAAWAAAYSWSYNQMIKGNIETHISI